VILNNTPNLINEYLKPNEKIITFCYLTVSFANAQDRVITTAVPFLLSRLTPEPQKMADIGVATRQMLATMEPAKYGNTNKAFSMFILLYLTNLVK
jgi:hypothetical protein